VTVDSPLDQPNLVEQRSYTDTTLLFNTGYQYQVVAKNTVGYLDGIDPAVPGFPEMTAQSISDPVTVAPIVSLVAAPTNLTAALLSGPTRVQLAWTDNATNETGFVIERSVNGAPFVQFGTRGPRGGTGNTTFTTNTLVAGNTYTYRVKAVLGTTSSAYSNEASVTMPALPAAPSNLAGSAVRIPGNNFQDRATLTWTDNANIPNNETSFQIQRSTSSNFNNSTTYTVGADVTTFSQNVSRALNYYYRVRARNAVGNSAWTIAVFVTTP
jgi:hypothetical protein